MRTHIDRLGGIVAALAFCAGCSQTFVAPTAPSGQTLTQQNEMAPFVHGPYLYVGGSTISMYRLGSAKPLRSVSSAYYTHVFALDSTGNLYAGNGNISWGTLSVYDARTLTLRDTFGGMDNSSSLAVDANDYLYDANCSPAIVVFAPGGGRIAGELRRGAFSVCSLGFDGSGNLYAANSSRRSISVYAPTSQP